MSDSAVLVAISLPLGAFYIWAFRNLSAEQWQIIATMPRRKAPCGEWEGQNLTWYGALTATAYVFAVSTFLILMHAVQVSLTTSVAIAVVTLAACVPASRWISRIVDRKPYGFTVAGAYTLGAMLLPVIVACANALAGRTLAPFGPTLAAAAIALTLGEGFGRLACISFGCCYGIPLAESPPLVAKFLGNRGFRFFGHIKKAAYEGHLSGVLLVPVQAMSTILLSATALAATALFVAGWYRTALVIAIAISQLWRLGSEWLRADDRGGGGMTAYQWMALGLTVFVAIGAVFIPHSPVPGRSLGEAAIDILWTPAALLTLQLLWLALFLYTGLSRTTGASLRFHVHHDRV